MRAQKSKLEKHPSLLIRAYTIMVGERDGWKVEISEVSNQLCLKHSYIY